MNILAKVQKHNLHFLDLDVRKEPDSPNQENQENEKNDPICNSCHGNLSEIVSKNEFEFFLKCKKNSKGLGGCSWTTCNKCIKEWYKHLVKKRLIHKTYFDHPNHLYTCPQCKVQKTFDIDFEEINEIILQHKQKLGQKLGHQSYHQSYLEKMKIEKMKQEQFSLYMNKAVAQGYPKYKKSDIKEIIKSNKNAQLLKTHVKNPGSGRWVLKTGKLGKEIISKKEIPKSVQPQKIKDKILNPISGKIVRTQRKDKKVKIVILEEPKGLRRSSRIKESMEKKKKESMEKKKKESVEKKKKESVEKKKKKKKNIIDDVFGD
jgi:hypothetical protein